MTNTVNKDFGEWLASFSGCDGGDLKKAKIWFCGIEWGLSKNELQGYGRDEWELSGDQLKDHKLLIEKYYVKKLIPEMDKGSYTPLNSYDIKEELYYQYGIKLAKLYSVLNGTSVEKYKEKIEKCEGSEIFKLNLYPIPFHEDEDSLWEKHLFPERTGLASKQIYRTICHFDRFEFIHSKVKEHNPELIIATGLSYLTDFVVCFAGKDGTGIINKETIKPQSKSNKGERTFYWTNINDNKTTLVATPFFGGSNGVNSDFLIEELGKRITEIKNQKNKKQ